MQSVKLITPKKIKTLHCFSLTILVLFLSFFKPAFSQDNSPYSRFGIGDLVPNTSITSRGMGGITAGYKDVLSINFNNPASYHGFQVQQLPTSKKSMNGRPIFDVGMNFETRTLQQTSDGKKFTASNALFSYVQIGVPIKRNWGLSLGLRPVSRISYKIFREETLFDPNTGSQIEKSSTRFEGDGGSYLATIGTGFTVYHKLHGPKDNRYLIEENLSFGFNTGYFFGKKDYASKRSIINDTVEYQQASYDTKTGFGHVYLDGGLQYTYPINRKYYFTLGAYGTLEEKINATQDKNVQTFLFDPNFGDVRLDSVSQVNDVKGKIVMPGSFTFGFVIGKEQATPKDNRWLLGLDLSMRNWNKYRFYGQSDSVKNTWQLRLGGQYIPAPKNSLFNNIAYRAGFFVGPDYINLRKTLPQYGVSLGFGLPIMGQNRLSPYQLSLLNLSFEYIKRGNNDNLLKENLFRVSASFSLTDIWFIKRRYD